MSRLRRALVNPPLKGILSLLCKVDAREYVDAIDRWSSEHPTTGLIIAINHINFLEVPMLVCFSNPRHVTGIVQAKAWGNPFMGFLFDTYDAIPLNRDGAYLHTFRKVAEALKDGYDICIAPEGTRSKNGILASAKPGIVQLAWMSGAPVLPLAHYGGQLFWDDLRHLRRTPFTFHAGKPFRFRFNGEPDKDTARKMTGELMGRIASLLPEDMRGVYAQAAREEPQYLESLPV
jgi:1-acyl-sn-glycerol-3-phosphate acyltransferase